MKKLLLVGMLLFNVVVFAQENTFEKAKPVTTEKEYNYLTKGLKIQEDSGLDIIDGYELEELQNLKVSNYRFDFKYLKEINTQQRKALSVIIESKVTNTKYYVCIPVRNADLTNSYASYVNQFDVNMSKAFAIALGIVTTDALTF